MLERRELDGGPIVLVSADLESRGFLVAFSERGGGTSVPPHDALNLGWGTSDDPSRILDNRRRLAAALGLPSFASPHQVHGTRVVGVGKGRAGAGFEHPAGLIAGTDALTTSSPGVALAVLTADCVPIALVAPREGRVTVAHAGWRGTAAGMVAAAVRATGEPRSLCAVIGPAVGPDHYEVGEDVALAVSAAARGGAVLARARGRVRLDLPATVERLLKEVGVRRIERDGSCTACRADRFFSYRRDGETGRQGLVALRLPAGGRRGR